MGLYERDDLRRLLAETHEARQRMRRAFDANAIDEDTFRRAETSARLTTHWIEDAIEIREGRSERTAAYDFKCREARKAIGALRDWIGMDEELRRLLEEEDCDED